MSNSLNLPDLLKATQELGGSDLHLSMGSPPQVRVDGHLQRLDFPELTPDTIKALAYSVLTDVQKKKFEETWELDLAFGLRGVGRFRCNVFNQKGAVGAVFRLIPEKIRPPRSRRWSIGSISPRKRTSSRSRTRSNTCTSTRPRW
jgi:twitching motility protein PilT